MIILITLQKFSFNLYTVKCLYKSLQRHSDQGFLFYRANIHTHIHTSWQSDRNIRAAVLRRRRGYLDVVCLR